MNIIQVNDVYKSFKVYYDKGATLKEKVLFKKRNRYEEHKVLKGINLSVKKGEVLGLIGQNGCGKSTLLKLMTRIIYPDKGDIDVIGKVSSLLELGAGFHPDMTGRENVYTNASIFGLSKKETDKRIEHIIEFSELGEFIDNPVRTYSSGMYMRLAFSVAINVEAEILFIDEILAVGDTNFQAKCFNKLREIKNSGVTIAIVSHDLSSIEKLCDKVVWINQGEIVEQGSALMVIDAYLQFMNKMKVEQLTKNENKIEKTQEKIEKAQEKEVVPEEPKEAQAVETVESVIEDKNRWGTKEIEITDACIINSKGKRTKAIYSDEEMCIEIHYKVNKAQEQYIFGMGFYTLEGVLCYGNNTHIDRLEIKNLEHIGVVKFKVTKCNLLKGDYYLNVAIVDKNGRALDFVKYYMTFTVVCEDQSVGIYSLNHVWEIR